MIRHVVMWKLKEEAEGASKQKNAEKMKLILEGLKINIEEIKVELLYDSTHIKTIKELDLRNKTGCTVIGFKDDKGEYIVNPEAETKLVSGSKIIVLGRPEQIERLNSKYNIEQEA